MIEGYRLLLASSVGDREGMAIELALEDGTRVAEVFEDDETGRQTVNVFLSDVPIDAIEMLLAEARARL
ncbi:hypothetical protein [Nocardioides sp. YIM 152315]|uniref:hypothetical protein n=1 Tax=Nocardioides sp. YIM 152315 TaxID=3031760 RepID=UPI0023DC62DB|nr:hypothetical protein [Nocardioides sp. YIM 152315]MDF1605811.1 hypothetical protein [Nocardioides sp. YIM 152315]